MEGKRNGKLNVAPGVTVKVDVVRMSNKYEEYDTIKVTCSHHKLILKDVLSKY